MLKIMDALGSLLSRAGHLLRQRTTEELADLELDPRTAGVLLALLEDGPANLTDLGHATRIDRTSIGQRVDELTDRGLLDRARSQTDRRVVLVRLTGAGETTARDVARRVASVEQEVTAVLDDEERELLRALLRRVVHQPHPQEPDQ